MRERGHAAAGGASRAYAAERILHDEAALGRDAQLLGNEAVRLGVGLRAGHVLGGDEGLEVLLPAERVEGQLARVPRGAGAEADAVARGGGFDEGLGPVYRREAVQQPPELLTLAFD